MAAAATTTLRNAGMRGVFKIVENSGGNEGRLKEPKKNFVLQKTLATSAFR
jgi:hypothetical protein